MNRTENRQDRRRGTAFVLRRAGAAAFAGIPVLSLILAMMILLASLTSSAVFAAAGTPGDSWSDTAENEYFTVHIGTDTARPFTSFSRYYPIRVQIMNRGTDSKDFEGVLKLMFPVSNDTGQAIALGQDIHVPAGSSETVSVDVPAFCVNYSGGTNLRHFIARADILNQKGEQVFSGGFQLRNQLPDTQASDYTVLTGLITNRAGELDGQYAYDMKDGSIQLPASSDLSSQAALPDESGVEGAEPEELEENGSMTTGETADYGQVMLEGSGYYSALQVLDPEEADSCVLSGYHVMILDAPAGTDLWARLLSWVKDGGILLAGEPWLKGISPAQAKAGDGYRLGYGKVIAFPADNSRDIPAYEELCRTLLQDTDIELARDLGMETRGSRADSGVYDYDITDRPPDVYRYLAALALYMLVIGPVLYHILKRRDRLEWLWAAVPVLSLAASIVIYSMGIGQRMTAVSGEVFSTVLMGEEGSVEHSLLKVVNPGKNKTMFSLSPDYKAVYFVPYQGYSSLGSYHIADVSYAEPADEDLPALMKANYLLALTGSEGRQDVLLGRNRIFSEYGVVLDRQLQDTGVLRTDLSCWKGMLYGTVENLTDCDLEDAFILRGPLYYPIGSVKAGEKINLDGISSFPVYQLQDAGSSAAVPLCEDPQAYHLGNAYAVRECMRMMLNSLHDTTGGENLAGGFTDSYQAGLDGSQFSKLGRLAMLYSYTDIQQSGSSWMSSGPLWGTPYSSADEENYAESEHMMYGTQIELLYQLKAGQKTDGLIWLNPDPDLHVSFYNVKGNRYEEVMAEDVREMDSTQLSAYISSHRQIRVKVQLEPDVYSTYHMTPAFEIYGGDRDD